MVKFECIDNNQIIKYEGKFRYVDCSFFEVGKYGLVNYFINDVVC